MSKVTETSAPEDFAAYKSLQSATAEGAPPEPQKPAPDAEPEELKQEPKKLSEEDKAERERRRDQRRERRWYEERGAMREEMRQMREELERAKSQREQSPAKDENAKPTLKQFLESGKHKTYEDAQEAFTDALTDWKLAQRESEREGKDREADQREMQTAFQKDVKAFSKGHDDFDEVFEVVKDRLDSDALFLSDAIVRSENPAQLIYELGTNEELLDQLLELPPQRAIMQLGKIMARLEGSKEKAPAKEITTTGKPKAPKTVSGRGSVVSRDERMAAAAASGDFPAFQAASRAKD